MEREIISNSSSLIFIGKLRIIDLLKNMFSKIIIPEDVVDEIFKKDCSENIYLQGEIGKFIEVSKVKELKDFSLGKGEKASISLCIEKNLNLFLSDDKKARNYAGSLRINTLGVLGVILWNLKNKKIEKKQAKNIFNKLLDHGYYLNSEVYKKMSGLLK